MIPLVILLALSGATAPDCDKIRSNVAIYGEKIVTTWAKLHGYKPSDIARIRKVCGL